MNATHMRMRFLSSATCCKTSYDCNSKSCSHERGDMVDESWIVQD